MVVRTLQTWATRYGVVVTVYLILTWLTDAYFMADTADYVDSIEAYAHGAQYDFWEFGHLLWRPLGWALFVFNRPLISAASGTTNLRLNVTLTLVSINWLAGLASVLLLRALVSHLTPHTWVAVVTTIAFTFAHGFLNFAQTGCSYVPGLSLLLLGIYLLVVEAKEAAEKQQKWWWWWRAAGAGLALAGAVCLWFLYVWAIPAALTAPFFLVPGRVRRNALVAAQAGAVFMLITGLAYAAVVFIALGIDSFAKLHAWIASASHGTDIKGATRVVFGLARSFLNMGNDGLLFKRYLVGDPFNPVALPELLRFSLWKLALFYLFLAALGAALLRSAPGRRTLILLAINAVPVLLFAIFFDGGAIERYLPLYPLFFLALASCLTHAPTPNNQRRAGARAVPKYIALVFVAAMALINTGAMAKTAVNRRQEAVAARVSDLLPQLKPQSRLFAVNWQDELINFSRSFPFHPITSRNDFHINALLTPGTEQVLTWRQEFASRALAVWDAGGDVWVSVRATSPRPRPNWNWVEGDDTRVSWADVHAFFAPLETDFAHRRGGEEKDGFMLLPRSPENERYLRRFGREESFWK